MPFFLPAAGPSPESHTHLRLTSKSLVEGGLLWVCRPLDPLALSCGAREVGEEYPKNENPNT